MNFSLVRIHVVALQAVYDCPFERLIDKKVEAVDSAPDIAVLLQLLDLKNVFHLQQKINKLKITYTCAR